MAYYRMRPPSNEQDYVGSCWAAALDSFSAVTPGVPRQREDDLVDQFSDSEDGWLSRDGRGRLRRHLAPFGVKMRKVRPLDVRRDIETRLRQSHVVLVFRVDVSTWHAWVVYGVDNWILYMDPFDGWRRTLYWPNRTFEDRKGYYLIWRP